MASTSLWSPPPITNPLPLRYFATRSVALHLFKANIRWRRLTDVAISLKDFLRKASFPIRVKKDLHDALGKYTGLKHVELFEEPSKGKTHRGEHLRTYYSCLTWRSSRYELDDEATARAIIAAASDWRQLQFLVSCCYAFTDLLMDRWNFDPIRLRTFKKQLAGHPVYDFWLQLLEIDEPEWQSHFGSRGVVPNQRLSLCFQFAIRFGYFQLLHFLWQRTSPLHREYIGLLMWKHVCFSAVHRETARFLCHELCALNAQALARITWTYFYDALYKCINEDEAPKEVKDNRLKLEFLMENSCPTLRASLLAMENFRVVTDAFRYHQTETFALFLENLSPQQLPKATEVVDRIAEKRPDQHRELRQMVVRRQQTVD